MKKVLILIPTYNEVMNIASLIRSIKQVEKKLTSYILDVLVLDDHSQDGTAAVVKELQADCVGIYLSSGKRQGLGKAYIRGLKYGLKRSKYSLFILMDADLSHNPKDIPKLLQAIQEGHDYAIGSRYVAGGSTAANWPQSRRIISRAANFAAKTLTGTSQEITDLTGGFKAIRVKALKRLNLDTLQSRGYVFQVSLLYACIKSGFRIIEVPIAFTNREKGRSKLKLRDIFEFIYRTYKLNPDAPIQRFVRFGFVGACGTIVNLVVLTILYRLLLVNALLAVAIAIEISIIFNFLLNHFYTFRGYGAYSQTQYQSNISLMKLLKFNLGASIGAVISFAAFTLLFEKMQLHYIIADLLAIVVALSWNYWISTRFVWKAIDKPQGEEAMK